MTTVNFLLILIASCLAVSAIAAILLYKRLSKTLITVEHAAQRMVDLSPSAARFLNEAAGELSDLRGLTRRTEAVTANVQAITGEIRQGAEFLNLARRSHAVMAGARAGLAVLKRASHHTNGKGEYDEQ